MALEEQKKQEKLLSCWTEKSEIVGEAWASWSCMQSTVEGGGRQREPFESSAACYTVHT